jgi:outer membrane biosynthesis protein TonB
MAQRESTVYIALITTTGVLLILMVVLLVLENSRKSGVEGQLAKSKEEIVQMKNTSDRYLRDLAEARTLLGGPEAAEAWPGAPFYKEKLKDAETYLNDVFQKQDNRAPKTLQNLMEALPDYKDIMKKVLETRQILQEKQKRAEEEKKEQAAAHKDETQKKEELIASLKSANSETETKYEKKITELTKEGERLQKELATTKDQMATDQINAAREKSFRDNVIASLQTRLDQLMEEQRKTKTIEDIDPDGKILKVASASQVGWINIGRVNHLRPGLEFRVFQSVKGGKRQYKGMIEIQQVDETISRFRVVNTDDELNPITEGDFITSPFYDPKAVPIFVFAGKGLESKDVTEETLRAKIKAYGAEIRDDVDLKTSFLIALKDYDKSPHDKLYKTARDLGVAVVRERDILGYMGL